MAGFPVGTLGAPLPADPFFGYPDVSGYGFPGPVYSGGGYMKVPDYKVTRSGAVKQKKILGLIPKKKKVPIDSVGWGYPGDVYAPPVPMGGEPWF